MKRNVLCATMILVAGSLMAADKDDVSAAIDKLASSDSYSWTSTPTNNVDGGGGGRRGGFGGGFGGGAASGKALKSGLIAITNPGRGGGEPTVSFVKGTNGAFTTQDGTWQSISEALADPGDGGGFNFASFRATTLQNTETPAQTAKSLLNLCKSVAKEGDAYVGELTDDGAKAQLQFPGFGGPRGGRGGPGAGAPGGDGAPAFTIDITDAKASVKFWVKDGVLAKYELNSKGKRAFGGQDPMDVDTTTIVEIKDVGATKIDMPDEAKKKLP